MVKSGESIVSEGIESFFDRLDGVIATSSAVNNEFFDAFRRGGLNESQLQVFADQYYYYIRTFPQILAGLSHRVEHESIRVALAKTVVSELGNGEPGQIHFEMFERAIGQLGVAPKDIREVEHITEVVALVEGIREQFLEGSLAVALGGHYVIEQTGLPMMINLYEGFRTYPLSTVGSLEYFYLHLLVEQDHVIWIKSAVRQLLTDSAEPSEVERGVTHFINLLSDFWRGLYGAVYSRS